MDLYGFAENLRLFTVLQIIYNFMRNLEEIFTSQRCEFFINLVSTLFSNDRYRFIGMKSFLSRVEICKIHLKLYFQKFTWFLKDF